MNFRPHGSGIILGTILGAAAWIVGIAVTLWLWDGLMAWLTR
jgi:hypothetical protein